MKKQKGKEMRFSELDLVKKIRRCWTRDPVEKIVPSKKVYDRKKFRLEEESS